MIKAKHDWKMNGLNWVGVSTMTVREVRVLINGKIYDVEVDIDVPYEELMYNVLEQFTVDGTGESK